MRPLPLLPLLPLALWAVGSGCAGPDGDRAPTAEYREVAERLTAFVEHERRDKGIPAISLALVDDQDVVWARGFGVARAGDSTPATAATVYRVGSVSKLFTDLAVMRLVERGAVALDSPVTAYLPDFHPANPFEGPVTLRALMAHRAGLVREPPVGHYFDSTGPTLAATVASLNATTLVYPPGERTKYSNAGIAVVGRVLEQVAGEPFGTHLTRAVLAPLGMRHSGFARDSAIEARLADGVMWSYHGDPFPAPTFELGMAPAGSLYAPVTDLARFLEAVFAGGVGARRVVADTTLAAMLRPQFAPDTASTGYGLGFALGRLGGERKVGHGGAIYGFSTQLSALPDAKLGVVVAASLDVTNAVVERIADYALRLMLARRAGGPLPAPEVTGPAQVDEVERATGVFAGAGLRVVIDQGGDSARAWLSRPGRRVRLRGLGDTLVVDDRLGYGPRVLRTGNGIVIGRDTLARETDRLPPATPAAWGALVGEYGWPYDVLYLLERDGRPSALIEWFFEYSLTQVARDTFAFPDWGLYQGERLTVARDANGAVTGVRVGAVDFPRRPQAGATFRIRPTHPVDSLRTAALAATPPANPANLLAPDLVEVRTLDPTIRYDIRYADTTNFMGTRFYRSAHAFLQRPAAEALVRAHRRLRRLGLGILVHDTYRPWFVTRMFWDGTPDSQRIFVADPAQGSRHNRGAAADVALYDLATGRPVALVSGYDEFSDRAFPDYPGGTGRQRWYRAQLREAMEAEGFTVYRYEWWHFDYGDWRRYPILNLPFDQLAEGTR